jgi:hypothetical protein
MSLLTQKVPLPQDMSDRKDYCVGCEASLVDELVEGDLMDGFSDDIYFENARDNKTFANMVVGSVVAIGSSFYMLYLLYQGARTRRDVDLQ